MKYFGIPTCPYCKKRVNLIRVWSLKKHGEYRGPRCKGISNIYLSPLVYLFALIAVAAGFLIYFFAKFISDNVNLMTVVEVFLPFAAFFLVSLFLVYLEKPVIKRVKKTADGRYFDEDGNELKMRMGKLVKKAEPVRSRSEESSRIVNSCDMTDGEPQDFGQLYGEEAAPVRTVRTGNAANAGAVAHAGGAVKADSSAPAAAAEKVITAEEKNSGDVQVSADFSEAQEVKIPVAKTRKASGTAADHQSDKKAAASDFKADDIMNYVPGDDQTKFYTNSSFPDDEALYAAAARKTGNNAIDFIDMDTSAAPKKRERKPASVDEPIKAGKIVSERDKGGDAAPNSGFEDLFDSYRNTGANTRKNEGNRERRFRDL